MLYYKQFLNSLLYSTQAIGRNVEKRHGLIGAHPEGWNTSPGLRELQLCSLVKRRLMAALQYLKEA